MIPLLLLVASALAAWEPSPDVAEPFNDGIIALVEGEPSTAEAAFRQALQATPDCGRCAHGLGIALVRQQRLDDARDVLRRAVAAFPDRPELRTALAGADFAAQDFDAALRSAKAAAGLDPTSVDAHVALTQVLLRLGRVDEAHAALDAGSLPGPERACLQILVSAEEGGSVGGTQVAYCRQAVHPGLASTVEARLAADSGQLSATAAAAARSGVDTVQQVAQALRLHQQGRDDQALPLLDAALLAEPQRVDARILRALARARTSQEDGALADLQHVFDARAWIQVHKSGEMSGVLTASDEQALRHSVRQGAGLLVSLLVGAGRLDDAEAALTRAEQELGSGVELAAGEVRLRAAQDRLAEAWQVLAEGMERWPEDGDLELLASELAGRDPQGVPPAVASRIATTTDWRARYHLAAAAARMEDHAGCTTLAEAAATAMQQASNGPTGDDRLTVRRLWHTCAVNAEQLDQAERAASALGEPSAMNEVARINHALLRHQAGDQEGALDLLRELSPSTEPRRTLSDQVQARAAAALGTCDSLPVALRETCQGDSGRP